MRGLRIKNLSVAPRSFCERVGSYMHDIFHVDAACSAARAVHHLHIREGRLQCLGSARDNAIIAEVARVMQMDLGKCALVNRRQVRRRASAGQAAASSFTLSKKRATAASAVSATGKALPRRSQCPQE